jgi:hypothetical protein
MKSFVHQQWHIGVEFVTYCTLSCGYSLVFFAKFTSLNLHGEL